MSTPDPKRQRLVLTGAAGLVGQNLVVELVAQGYSNIVAIDKHVDNLAVLKRLHPQVETIEADLAEPGRWEDALAGADCVVQLLVSLFELSLQRSAEVALVLELLAQLL